MLLSLLGYCPNDLNPQAARMRQLIILAATFGASRDRGTFNLAARGNLLLFMAIAVASVLIVYFALEYFFEWRLRRDIRRSAGPLVRKSHGFLWYWFQDWKNRRECQRSWNRRRVRPKK